MSVTSVQQDINLDQLLQHIRSEDESGAPADPSVPSEDPAPAADPVDPGVPSEDPAPAEPEVPAPGPVEDPAAPVEPLGPDEPTDPTAV